MSSEKWEVMFGRGPGTGVLSLLVLVAAAAATGSGCGRPSRGPILSKPTFSPDARPEVPWRALADYPRPPAPDTGWGIHDNPNCVWTPDDPDAFFKELKQRYGLSWFKVLACGRNKLDVVRACRRQGVEPVVRLYVSHPAPHYPRPGEQEAKFREYVAAYVAAGAHYIEAGNEPNLSIEWADGEWEKGNLTQRVCEQWLRVRKIIAEEGGIPVFYAMSVGGEEEPTGVKRSAGAWWDDCFQTFAQWGKTEEAFAGTAFGTHLGTVNHPLDYPFDPQRNMPHASRAERFDSLMKRNTGYLGGELLMYLMEKYLPYPIPILSTEGGTFVDDQADKSYPMTTPEIHRDWNVETFRRFNPEHPKYWGDLLFAQMSWCWHGEGGFAIDSWHDNPKYGRMPILDALEKEPRFDRGIIFQR